MEAIPEKRRVSIAHPMSSTRRYTARMRFETRANALIKSPRISEVVPTLVDHSIFRTFHKGALGTLRVSGDENKATYSGQLGAREWKPN